MKYEDLQLYYEANPEWDEEKFHVFYDYYSFGWTVIPPNSYPAQELNVFGAPTFEMAMKYADLFGQILELNREWYD